MLSMNLTQVSGLHVGIPAFPVGLRVGGSCGTRASQTGRPHYGPRLVATLSPSEKAWRSSMC